MLKSQISSCIIMDHAQHNQCTLDQHCNNPFFQLTIHTGLSLQGSIITEIKNCYQKGSSMIKPCSPQQCFCHLYIITMAVKQFSPPYNLHGANDMVQNYRKLFTKRIFRNKYLQDMVSGCK